MTPAQKNLYWRTWQRVATQSALRWSRFDDKAPGPSLVDSRVAAVRTAAEILAGDGPVKPDHYRHAIHLIALGDVVSSRALSKPQFDRVIAYMQALLNPSDVEARERDSDRTIATRRGLVARCKGLADEAYIDTICRRKFGAKYNAPWWEDLQLNLLRQLTVTLVHMDRRKRGKEQ